MTLCIDHTHVYSLEYTICTLVNDMQSYVDLVKSFNRNGFDDTNSTFMYVDNSHGNKFEAYEAIRHFLFKSNSKYIIICHQDIELIDNKSCLDQQLNLLESYDSLWAIAGNAGGKGVNAVVKYVTNSAGKEKRDIIDPTRVYSLDENFLIIKKAAQLSISKNLSGFHFYGTDLCLIADILGYRAYVIPFMVRHYGCGNWDRSFYLQQKNLVRKYEKAFSGRFIESTCSKFYISGSFFKNKLFNKFVRFITYRIR